MVAYSVVQEILDELDSADRTVFTNVIILESISHYVFCATDMPTTLVDLTSSVLNQITLNQQTICIELLPLFIKAFYHCSLTSPETTQGNSLYSELDYVVDKMKPLFAVIRESMEFLLKDWQYQRYFCTILAEIQYFYYKGML